MSETEHRAAVLWFTFLLAGASWKVWISNKKLHPFLDGLNGKTDVDSAEIYISADCADERKPETFIHEMLHALMFASGYQFTVGLAIENSSIDPDDREEARISCLSPFLWDTLARNGMLKLPKIPAKASLLRTNQ